MSYGIVKAKRVNGVVCEWEGGNEAIISGELARNLNMECCSFYGDTIMLGPFHIRITGYDEIRDEYIGYKL